MFFVNSYISLHIFIVCFDRKYFGEGLLKNCCGSSVAQQMLRYEMLLSIVDCLLDFSFFHIFHGITRTGLTWLSRSIPLK